MNHWTGFETGDYGRLGLGMVIPAFYGGLGVTVGKGLGFWVSDVKESHVKKTIPSPMTLVGSF